jgi:hypothetical protein
MPQQFDTSWFDLKKYEDLRNLDLISWLSQIKKRSSLDWILHHKDSSFNYPQDGSVEDEIIETLQLILPQSSGHSVKRVISNPEENHEIRK